MSTRHGNRLRFGHAVWLALGAVFLFPLGASAADRAAGPTALSKGKVQTKPNSTANLAQRRVSPMSGSAMVTPIEPVQSETRSALPIRDRGREPGNATAAPLEPATADTSQALPMHRRRPIDFEATAQGPAGEEMQPASQENERVRHGDQMVVAQAERVLGVDQRRESMPIEDNNSDLYKGNRVSFRGGYVSMLSNRSGEIFTDVQGAAGNNPADKGYYVGASLDMLLACNLWGLLKGASALGEINVEYKHLNSERVAAAVPTVVAGATVQDKVDVTMLTVSISPKIKFNDGKAFRPWIIPIGLDVHVISPPSNRTQYLDIGAQFGAGAEYQVWREFKVGVEGRFHLAANQTQTVNSFWNAGPYVSIGF